MSNTVEARAEPDSVNRATSTVFSSARDIIQPEINLSCELKLNSMLEMDGLEFLSMLPEISFPVVFFDPQYRGILDKMSYGNEGKQRGKRRSSLLQMTEQKIKEFIVGIDKILMPSGHLFLWIDKFHLCQGFKSWIDGTNLDVVDMIVWNKKRMGMGYRTRRMGEYLVIFQKQPRKAKGVWKLRNIPDVWTEQVKNNVSNPHRKPVELQSKLIASVSNEGDIIVDPAAGSFSVMEAAHIYNRNFLGCDISVQ